MVCKGKAQAKAKHKLSHSQISLAFTSGSPQSGSPQSANETTGVGAAVLLPLSAEFENRQSLNVAKAEPAPFASICSAGPTPPTEVKLVTSTEPVTLGPKMERENPARVFQPQPLFLGTAALVLADQVALKGAAGETVAAAANSEYSERIVRHEAGHVLLAYLLGCPVQGCVLSARVEGFHPSRYERASPERVASSPPVVFSQGLAGAALQCAADATSALIAVALKAHFCVDAYLVQQVEMRVAVCCPFLGARRTSSTRVEWCSR